MNFFSCIFYFIYVVFFFSCPNEGNNMLPNGWCCFVKRHDTVVKLQVSGAALAYVVRGNPGLKCLKARGCKNLFQQGSNGKGEECSFSHSCKELYLELAKTCKLEEFSFGWGFSHFSLEALGPAITSLKKINMGLGASLSHDALTLLPTTCPFLESVILYFQVLFINVVDVACKNEIANQYLTYASGLP